MTIFLIGKNGQLGSEIDRQARERKIKIFSFDHKELDISDSEKILNKIGSINPEIVINASAFHVVPKCEAESDKAFLINATSLIPITKFCEEKNIKFVHYSTDYVFDGVRGKPNDENEKPNPVQIYGISKLAGEYIVLNYSKRSVVIRPSGVYGGKKGSRSKKGNFALNIIEQARGKRELEVASEQVVNPTYSVDLAGASLDLLAHKEVSGVYHLANEGFCSWAQFAKEILKIKKLNTKIIPVDRGGLAGDLRRPLFSALKNTRAKKLGIVLPTWQDAIGRYLEFIQ